MHRNAMLFILTAVLAIGAIMYFSVGFVRIQRIVAPRQTVIAGVRSIDWACTTKLYRGDKLIYQISFSGKQGAPECPKIETVESDVRTSLEPSLKVTFSAGDKTWDYLTDSPEDLHRFKLNEVWRLEIDGNDQTKILSLSK